MSSNLGDVAQSQVSGQRKDIEELKLKLLDYEKMTKFQKVVSSDDKQTADGKQKLEEMKKQLASEQKERKTEVNNIKMKYDSKTALMNEEIMALKAQCSKYKRDRENYKEMLESAQKSRSGRTSAAGDEVRIKIIYIYVYDILCAVRFSKIQSSPGNLFFRHLIISNG